MIASLALEPGVLPTQPPPSKGDSIAFEVDGLPPYKDPHFSLRNRNSPQRAAFIALREAATKAMAGRRWYDGPVGMEIVVRHPSAPPRELLDYVGGIFDTLDGSHGPSFTYLPIVYQDDCQVCLGRYRHEQAPRAHYQIDITFLGDVDRARRVVGVRWW